MTRREKIEAAMAEAMWKPESFPRGRTIWKRGALAAEFHNGQWEVWGQDGWAVHRGYDMPQEYLLAAPSEQNGGEE